MYPRTLSSVLFLLVTALAIPRSSQFVITTQPTNTWNVGSGFQLTRTSNGIQIDHDNQSIWSATLPFVSASAGNDSVVGSSGAFNITNVDIDTCQGQDIGSVQKVPWKGAATGHAVQIIGRLLDCADATASYTLTFWVPSTFTDRVAFHLDISESSNVANPLKKLYVRFASNADEDFYGLGAQASFASLKGQSVPVFSREQGVGRGDEPLTSYENENGTFSGGDRFTTYTAVPSYISSDGNLFYLCEKSTAYAEFDFTQDDLVSVRYDYLSVDGMFTRSNDMFGAVEKLTAYTGRMPALPSWVDEGAILGIQGGQAKVNRIIEQGLGIGCPISAVWLQDWCGTRKCNSSPPSLGTSTNPQIDSQEGPYINISRLWWNWENDEDLQVPFSTIRSVY